MSERELDPIEELTEPGYPRDIDGVPYCRKHHCRMKVASSGKKGSPTRYHACPVPKCNERAQTIKTERETVVPPAPLACPRCSTENSQVFCERDDKASDASRVILRCPNCQWKSTAFVSPHLAALQARKKPDRSASDIPDLGER